MSNIFRGIATEKEIKTFIGGRPLVTIYAKDKDNPNVDGDYPFWSNIKHPGTGKVLHAVKGYCEPSKTSLSGDRLCYYAEYSDEKGRSYYYIDSRFFHQRELRGNKSIEEQQHEDAQELRQRMGHSIADEEFLEHYNSRGISAQSSDEEFFIQTSKHGPEMPIADDNNDVNSGTQNKMGNGIL